MYEKNKHPVLKKYDEVQLYFDYRGRMLTVYCSSLTQGVSYHCIGRDYMATFDTFSEFKNGLKRGPDVE